MHKSESVIENETLLSNFEIQDDQLTSHRRADLGLITKKKKKKKRKKSWERIFSWGYSVVPMDHRMKIEERKRWDKCLDIAWDQENYEGLGSSPEELETRGLM